MVPFIEVVSPVRIFGASILFGQIPRSVLGGGGPGSSVSPVSCFVLRLHFHMCRVPSV
jgi:hypothetical protein